MVTNPDRRIALLDAALDVLAEEGARGLTFRRVDERAAVPRGTASNYFPDRDELLAQVGSHVYLRFTPEPGELDDVLSGAHDREHLAATMRRLVHRLVERRTVYLALLELRLEATRRPELRQTLTRRVSEDLAGNIAFHDQAAMPGGSSTVLLLYFALNWLVTEHLTLPGVLDGHGSLDELVDLAVEHIAPAE
jgi:DNA-binding transcriptional regulator YbjK